MTSSILHGLGLSHQRPIDQIQDQQQPQTPPSPLNVKDYSEMVRLWALLVAFFDDDVGLSSFLGRV